MRWWFPLLLAACAAPDTRATFQPDWKAEVADDDAPVETPERWTPRLAEGVPFELPADGGPLALSIEQAVMLALAHNRDLQTRQLGPVIAGTFEQIERGVFDPELFAELEYGRESSEETSRSTGERFDVDARDSEVVAGVRQDLPSGTSVEGTVEQTRDASNRAPEQQIARVGLTVTQQLLRGFGPAVNLARVRQAELETEASAYELRRFTEVVLADAKIAYWNFVQANQAIAIFTESLALARRQLEEIEERIAVGVLPDTEAAAARAEVALREQALIQAESEREERRLRLLRVISPSPDGRLDFPLRATSAPDIDPAPVENVDERLALALRQRPEINEARLRLEQDRLEVVVTRDGVLPKLELFLTFGKTGYDDTLFGSFGALDGRTWDASVGLRLSRTLGNREAKALDRAARATRWQAVRAIDNLEQLVRFEVRLAANEVERARKQIAATRTTRELQERTVEAEQERFNVGASTALLVAQAQRDLLAIRIAEVETVVTYRIAVIRLQLAEGSLLERHGVVLDD
jgi:outer membrane protein TolC